MTNRTPGSGPSKPGDPGQAGTYDPTKGGKFEPGTKAKPAPESPHSTPGDVPKKKR